ncbi:hypothetical protein ACIPC1_13300 [Streptomyces sp. NPDC087263]|uniref:hypothetical protein n=1 Tax=Streptomyces sp. NPDC087263 TaxID=3365773 RepID=UPI0037FD79DE
MSSSAPTPPGEPAPFLTLHAALVLLTAAVIGLFIGGLTFLGGASVAGSVLAGMVGGGGSVPVLRSLIGS